MKTQQCCVLLGAFGEVILGLLLVLLSSWSMDPYPPLHFMEPFFAPVVLAVGGAFAATGCLGVVGACIASRRMLCLYAVTTLLVAAVAFLVGGLLLATVNGHGEEIIRACGMKTAAGQMFSKMATTYQASYDSMKQGLVNCRRNGRQNALGLQDCGQLGRDNEGRWYLKDPFQELFEWIEAESGCGGFCVGDIPLFAYPTKSSGVDVQAVTQSSKQKARQPCFKELVDRLEVSGDRDAAVIVGFALPLFLAVCGAMWIVCYPPPVPRKNYIHSPFESGHLLESSDEDDESDFEEQKATTRSSTYDDF